MTLPKGWSSKNFGEVANFFNGKPLEGDVSPDGNFNLITLDSVDIQGNLKRSHKKVKKADDFLIKGDIVSVLSDIAHGYLLGLSGLIPEDNLYVLNQRMGCVRVKSNFSSEFIRLLLNFNQAYFRERGQGTSQKHIYKRDFEQFDFVLPGFEEQKAIAEALSDIDELIFISKNELEKRHNIAFGVIGQIIDGSYFQSRSINCEFQTIKDLGIKVEKGALITEKTARPGKIPVIAGGFKPAYYHDAPNRTGTTITVSASGANAGFVNIWREEIWASDCSTISESSKYDVRYIYYVLLGLQKEIYKSQYGGAQPHVRPNEIYNLVIPWIKLDDQQVISKILEDTFLEIQIMENQILKYEWLKQGMMNDLLTGKVRLV